LSAPTTTLGAQHHENELYRQWQPTLRRKIQMAFAQQRFTCTYFGQLDVEYEALCDQAYKNTLHSEVAALRARNSDAPCWSLNHRLEFLLLEGLPEEILRQRSLVHRNRMLALVGDEGTKSFGEAFPEPTPDWPLAKLKEHARGVLLEVQRLRHVQTEFNRLRNRLLWVSIVPGCFFVCLALFCAHKFPGWPLVAAVAIFGLMGGYLSVLLRVGGLRWALKYAANYQQVDRLFWNLSLNFVLSMLQGSLGAVILYFVFSAGALSSPIFPDLTNPSVPPPYIPMALGDWRGILMVYYVSHRVFSQLMLFSTVAGFSERLMPDLLSNLSKEVTADKKSAS
jgi:hypothetical protein